MNDRPNIAPGEVLIRIDGPGPDSLGRQSFTAYWLDEYLPPDGVRGQIFHSDLDEFTCRAEALGGTVTVVQPLSARNPKEN